jgi:hypothetical protein
MIKNYLYALIILATVSAYCAAPAEAMPASSSAAPAEAAQPFSKQDILNYFGQMGIAQPATNSFDSNDIAYDTVYNNLSLAKYMEEEDHPRQSNVLQYSGQGRAGGSVPENAKQESDALKYAVSDTIAAQAAASHFAVSQATTQEREQLEKREKLLLARQAKLEQQAQAEQSQGAGVAARNSILTRNSILKRDNYFYCAFPGCNKSYPSRQAAIRHYQGEHENLRPHICDLCARGFKQKTHLQNHIRRHSGEIPFKCHFKDCNYAARQKANLTRHIHRKHQDEEPPTTSRKRRKKNSRDDENEDNDDDEDYKPSSQ